MDIPGLNETGNNKNQINNNFYFQQIIPIIQSNIKFAIFLFDIENYMGNDTTNIILNFKKPADLKFIITKDEEELQRKRNEENELKEIQKKLDEKTNKINIENEVRKINLEKSFENSIFIANKIDKIPKEEQEQSFNNFMEYIKNKFKVNLTINNSMGISAKKMELLLYKYQSLKQYIEYILFDLNDIQGNNFFIYLIENLKKDFKLKLKYNCYEKYSTNKKICKDEKKIKILNEINEKISNASFDNEMNYTQYKYFNNIFKKEVSKSKFAHNVSNDILENIVKNKMEDIIDEFLNFDDFTYLKGVLKDNLKLTEEEIKLNQSELLRQRFISLMNNPNSIENPKECIKSIEKYINKLLDIEKENNLLNNLNKEYERIKQVINFDISLRFCCFGCYSSGKSSLLNNLIGYNLNLLPVSSEECTKIGLIIKYTEKEDDISIYRINLIKQDYPNLNYFKYNKEDDRIVVGKDKVKEQLNKLNKSHKQFYYLLLTPIEILDELNIENDLKKRIEFIDFPGLNTSNSDLVNKEFNTILEMSNGFIYLNAGIEIQKNENKKILFNNSK